MAYAWILEFTDLPKLTDIFGKSSIMRQSANTIVNVYAMCMTHLLLLSCGILLQCSDWCQGKEASAAMPSVAVLLRPPDRLDLPLARHSLLIQNELLPRADGNNWSRPILMGVCPLQANWSSINLFVDDFELFGAVPCAMGRSAYTA